MGALDIAWYSDHRFVNQVTGEIIPFGAHHHELWDWAWALRVGWPAKPFVGIWPRAGGKSGKRQERHL